MNRPEISAYLTGVLVKDPQMPGQTANGAARLLVQTMHHDGTPGITIRVKVNGRREIDYLRLMQPKTGDHLIVIGVLDPNAVEDTDSWIQARVIAFGSSLDMKEPA